jgi:hypothetical protein
MNFQEFSFCWNKNFKFDWLIDKHVSKLPKPDSIKVIHNVILIFTLILPSHSPFWAIHKVHQSEDYSSQLSINAPKWSP